MTSFRMMTNATMLTLLLALPAAIAVAPGHFYGNGHADMSWVSSFFPPYVEGTGTGSLSTNLATFGEAIAWQMPLTTVDLLVLPASAPTPVQGTLVMDVPSAADPWWASYPGGIPPGIGAGGQVEMTLVGYAEHHPNAVTLYGTFTLTRSTGQYAGMVGSGDWTGATTGGPGSFGPYFDFAILGSYA